MKSNNLNTSTNTSTETFYNVYHILKSDGDHKLMLSSRVLYDAQIEAKRIRGQGKEVHIYKVVEKKVTTQNKEKLDI